MRNILVIFVALVLFAGAASAQSEKRIQFAKGKSSAVVTGSTGSTGTTYVLRARSGQKIILTLTPTRGVGIKVEHDGQYGQEVLLKEDRGGTYEVGLEDSGDYTIFLGSTNGKSTAFTLTVKIVRMTDI